MRIWFDTERLNSLNLVPSDVIAAMQSAERAGGGRSHRRAADRRRPQFQLNLQTQGRLTTPEEFGDIVLRANPDGSSCSVRDVARVEMGAAEQDTESRLDGNPAIAIGDLPLARRQRGGHLGARAADPGAGSSSGSPRG